MGSVDTSQFRKKLKIIIDEQPWIIVENDFVKPGKGQAFNRVKIKNLMQDYYYFAKVISYHVAPW